jgi:hypothetical protein
MDWLQSATFGKESNILLSIDPSVDHLEMSGVVDAVQSLRLSDQIDAVGSTKSWETLQKVSLGLADAGAFPKEVTVPVSGSKRLIFTNPSSIGPQPSYGAFHVNDLEKSLLGFEEDYPAIEAMDLASVRAFEVRLNKSKADLAETAQQNPGASDASTTPVSNSVSGTPRPAQPIKTIKSPRQTRRAAKKAAKLKKKEAKKAAKSPAATLPVDPSPNIPVDKELDETAISSADEKLGEQTETSPAENVDENGQLTPSSSATDNESNSHQTLHKPNSPSFKPQDYLVISSFYQGKDVDIESEYATVKPIYDSALRTYKTHNGLWTLKNTCDLCNQTFDHGVVFLHEPTQELIHVGHQCARKHFNFSGDEDVVGRKLAELEKRWVEWRNPQASSLLYRVGARIVIGLENAEQQLFRSIEFLESRPTDPEAPSRGKLRFRKWARRGFLVLLLIIAACVAALVFTALPLLLFVAIILVYWGGLITRLALLARDLVRDRYRQQRLEDEYDRAFKVGRHAANEIVRLAGMYEQFSDWQRVIREVTHIPFGRDLAFSAGKIGITDIQRPPGFIIAEARPDEEQKMALFLQAQSQTIHAGWLTEIMDILKAEWLADYKNARLISAGDNVHPEADNAPSGAVVGKRPMSNIDVYYPRTDFRNKVLDGSLQRKLVLGKSVQIASDLARRKIDTLLSSVTVTGPGSALNGQSPKEFLGGLSVKPEVEVGYDPELFSDQFPEYRRSVPEVVLPPYGTTETELGRIHVEPGVEYTAAAWKIELSGQIAPFDALKGALSTNESGFDRFESGPGVA